MHSYRAKLSLFQNQSILTTLGNLNFFVTLRQNSPNMKDNIIGRKEEIVKLEKYLASGKSEFVAIYGRRRVGKTFLVKELFEGKFAFRMTGKENANTKEQLENFHYALSNYTENAEMPKTWTQAFHQLEKYIEHEAEEGSKILFFDELPWFDTRGSKFRLPQRHQTHRMWQCNHLDAQQSGQLERRPAQPSHTHHASFTVYLG